MDPKYLQLERLQGVTQSGSWGLGDHPGQHLKVKGGGADCTAALEIFSPHISSFQSPVSAHLFCSLALENEGHILLLYVEITVFALFLL